MPVDTFGDNVDNSTRVLHLPSAKRRKRDTEHTRSKRTGKGAAQALFNSVTEATFGTTATVNRLATSGTNVIIQVECEKNAYVGDVNLKIMIITVKCLTNGSWEMPTEFCVQSKGID